jgi:hypothetical protein
MLITQMMGGGLGGFSFSILGRSIIFGHLIQGFQKIFGLDVMNNPQKSISGDAHRNWEICVNHCASIDFCLVLTIVQALNKGTGRSVCTAVHLLILFCFNHCTSLKYRNWEICVYRCESINFV